MVQRSKPEGPPPPEPTACSALEPLLSLMGRSEEWLMGRILAYARQRGYTKYTSTLMEAWRLSIHGISASLLESLGTCDGSLELGPDEDYAHDPAATFGILEARRHRERGVSLAMFLGLMKYYRQGYKDLLVESDLDDSGKTLGLLLVERFFDRMEIGFCSEWATPEERSLLAELQATNRLLTNEKNKYLTAFESLPDPAFIVDAENRVEHMNLSACLLFEEVSTPGASYYGISKQQGRGVQGGPAAIPLDRLLPWAADEVVAFSRGALDHHQVEKAVEGKGGKTIFQMLLSRMLDVSGKFEGTILVLHDVTAQRGVEEERLQKERLQAILEMAGAVCHELNQPLQGLTGHAELLMLDLERDDPVYARASKICDLVHLLGTITRQLAGITRYETREYLTGRIIDIQKSSTQARPK